MSAYIRSVVRGALMCFAIVGYGVTPSVTFAQTTINFDDVSNRTDVRMSYQSLGVTFTCDGTACSQPTIANGIYARATTLTPSTPNSVTPIKDGFPGVSDSFTGRVVAIFSSPVKTVSIDARAILVPEPLNQTAYANIIAFDAAGAIVTTTTGTQLNAFQTLVVTAPDNRIVKVSLGVTGGVAVATFDNLQFDRDPPMFWVLIIVFFIFIFVWVYWVYASRRKKNLPRLPTDR